MKKVKRQVNREIINNNKGKDMERSPSRSLRDLLSPQVTRSGTNIITTQCRPYYHHI